MDAGACLHRGGPGSVVTDTLADAHYSAADRHAYTHTGSLHAASHFHAGGRTHTRCRCHAKAAANSERQRFAHAVDYADSHTRPADSAADTNTRTVITARESRLGTGRAHRLRTDDRGSRADLAPLPALVAHPVADEVKGCGVAAQLMA